MTLKLKALLIALAAVLSMSGAAAASSSAAEFHAEASPFLTGTQEETDSFTTTAGKISCKEIKYLGAWVGTTSTSFVAEPTFSGCTAFGFGATVNTNGCDYEFHSNGSVDIQSCETAAGIIITANPTGTIKCVVKIPAQFTLGGATYKNIGAGTTRELTIEASLSALSYSEEAGTGLGACKSTVVNPTNGTYSGKLVMTGSASGVHRGIWFE
jgi:hypothetical protein